MWKCEEWWDIQLTLGIWCRPLSQNPPHPVTQQPHPLTPSAQTMNQEETKESSKNIKLYCIVITLYCLGLRTQNPEHREVDLEPSFKRGSDKINRRQPRAKNTTENKLYRTTWTHKKESSTLEPSVKIGTDRTKG